MTLPVKGELKGKWQQSVGSVKIAWGKLTDDEILQSEGQSDKLAGLVQERYAISRDQAEKEVKEFLDKNGLS
ncbi:CsbD family protein [Nitrincola alkalilacustris]|uniref:CsbD family protein n=1 Tax=Nitrincola alkalilacustris TaxID=1571224 RepID=UPI00124F19D4|nr:CsbD family protein [Nitrincola alkalilacustris]